MREQQHEKDRDDPQQDDHDDSQPTMGGKKFELGILGLGMSLAITAAFIAVLIELS